jgi:STE24 endopeptidase
MRSFFVMAALVAFATPAFAFVPVPVATPQAVAYQHGKDAFFLLDFVVGLAAAVLFMELGWSARLRNAATRVGRGRWFWVVSMTVLFYAALSSVMMLPLTWWETFLFPHHYAVSNETGLHWVKNQVIGQAVNAVTLLMVAWIPYLVLRLRPRDWYVWATAALLPFVVFFVTVGPVFVTPLFNHFGPLQDKRLESVLRAETQRVGLGDAPIYVMDQSTTSKVPGAYVTGLFGTREIVLYDTLVNTFDERQTKFVLGHEMKHYLLDDVWKLVAIFAGLLLAGFFVVDWLGRAALTRWGTRWGVTTMSDPASAPVLLAAFSLALFTLTPVLNLVTQSIEHEADRFGLELTQDNDAAASAFVKLQTDGLGVPDPGWVQRIWRTDHPTLRDRIEFTNSYHPWTDGKPLRYGGYIKP